MCFCPLNHLWDLLNQVLGCWWEGIAYVPVLQHPPRSHSRDTVAPVLPFFLFRLRCLHHPYYYRQLDTESLWVLEHLPVLVALS